jgi:tetratricopeptide repeat protein
MRFGAILLLLSCAALFCGAQTAPQAEAEPSSEARHLFAEERWGEVVQLAQNESAHSADLFYYYGVSLAKLGRWDEARNALQSGRRLRPMDERFPVELAGVAFQQKHYAQAASWLRVALRIDPEDSYANEFLATTYFVQNNLEAALKYWNRVGKPEIENIQTEPEPQIKPALLDRAFTFSPAGIFRSEDLLTTEARLNGLGIFPNHALSLMAREDGKFNVVLRARERNGWGDGKWTGLASLFRGAFYETVYPEYFNSGRSATNIQSLVRWDAQKRRAWVSLSRPLRENPKWQVQVAADLRNENWDVRDSALEDAPLLAALNMRRAVASARIRCFPSGRWNWSTGVEFSYRDYRNVTGESALSPSLLAQGYQLKHLAELRYQLARVPERRFVASSTISSQAGRIWSQPAYSFAKLQGSLDAHWFPQSTGEDYAMQARVSAGKTFGSSPFDELFLLGVDRDNDLWLRGHSNTRDGRKGNAPLGSEYFISNWETDKKIYSNGLLSVALGPFVDIGRIEGPSPDLGSHKWLYDTGLQGKVRVLGVRVAFSYGIDLRTGKNVFHVTTERDASNAGVVP